MSREPAPPEVRGPSAKGRPPAEGLRPEEGLRPAEGLRPKLAALWDRLTRPLWREPAPERARRQQRLVLQGPIGIVVGACFGILAGPGWGADPFLLALVCGSAGLLLMYLLGQAESWLRIRPRRRGGVPTWVVRVGADLVGGGIMGVALSYALGTDRAATLAAGASLLVGYSFVLSHLMWGGVVDGIVRFASGQGGSIRETDFSREQALAARGKVDEALDLYEAWCELRPGSPEPILAAAWMLREAGRWREAMAWYRRALALPTLQPGRAAAAARHVWEIAATKLDDPALALPDLERLLERYPGEGRHAWIEREVEEIRAALPPVSSARPARPLQGGRGESTVGPRIEPSDEETG